MHSSIPSTTAGGSYLDREWAAMVLNVTARRASRLVKL